MKVEWESELVTVNQWHLDGTNFKPWYASKLPSEIIALSSYLFSCLAIVETKS